MTTEVHTIAFAPHEIVAAIANFHRHRKLPIPSGKVVGMVFTAPPEIEGRFQILADGTDVPADFTLDSATLAASLVFHCINHGIPLPALATKQLRRHEHGLELVVSNMRHV
ncbi:hypothetical protein [Zavarzinia sp.]|uniref:hypothetical protein n=1 Tax=Zavarzinia sp. TaxID=2027920 RepID=UPI003BB6680D|nr:hypothetical protein [Zavarzinia sp.]